VDLNVIVDASRLDADSRSLRKIRIDRELTMAFVAESIGTSLSTLCLAESGQGRLAPRPLAALAKLYDLELADLQALSTLARAAAHSKVKEIRAERRRRTIAAPSPRRS
jgi:transcriptional regulator with XRE-family HTH domain